MSEKQETCIEYLTRIGAMKLETPETNYAKKAEWLNEERFS